VIATAVELTRPPRYPEAGLFIVLFYIPALCILLGVDVALKLFSKVDTETLWLLELGAIVVIIAFFANMA
jgi:hypothetical protein